MLHYLSVEHDVLFTRIVLLTEIPIKFELPFCVHDRGSKSCSVADSHL